MVITVVTAAEIAPGAMAAALLTAATTVVVVVVVVVMTGVAAATGTLVEATLAPAVLYAMLFS